MKKSEIVKTLKAWQQVQTAADAGIEPYYALFGCIDAPIVESFYRLAAAHTEVVARLVGDVDGWLSWYRYENDMGAREFAASPPNGKLRKVRTLAHLAALIVESRRQ